MSKSVVCAVTLASLSAAGAPDMARAQGVVAKVASVQRDVRRRRGANPFAKVNSGAPLEVGDGVSTGKRSKADIKFADGSLVRLGQLSNIEMQGDKTIRLPNGRVLVAALRPVSVQAGNGTAEIKGSVAVIALGEDNSCEYSLYIGAMDVVGDRTVSLQPGQSVRVDAQGRLSNVRRATPFGYIGGELNPDLVLEPELGPFTGSEVNEHIRDDPGRTAIDQSLNPTIVLGQTRRGAPIPTPFPTLGPGQALIAQRESAPLDAAPSSGSPRFSWSRSASSFSPRAPLMQMAPAPSASRIADAAPAPSLRLAQNTATATEDSASTSLADPAQNATPDAAAAGSAAILPDALDTAPGDFDIDTQRALAHIDEVDRSLGRFLSGDVRAVGAVADGGTQLYGARLRGLGAAGQVYFEGTLGPQTLRNNGNSGGYSSVPSAFVLLRSQRGEVRIGRQRFVAGPTQAAFYGSMIRQGGRETMDAIRLSSRQRKGVKLEAAYILDAFPRNLPFVGAQISGAQQGVYGRASLRRAGFSVGLNALRYTSGLSRLGLGAGTNDTLGATVDFAVPLLNRQVDFYGELGRDPFRRNLRTFGLGFPGLYDKTDFDAFLEYAHLGGGSLGGALGGNILGGVAATPPSELTLRVYRRVGRLGHTVATVSRFGGGAGWGVALGFSIGGRPSTRYGGLP